MVDLAGIDQLLALEPTDIDAIEFVSLQREARDGQRLPLSAGLFDPVIAPARCIPAIANLRYDAFEAGLAGVFVNFRAVIREGHGEACYIPSRDFISMPAFAGFKGADHFYNVVFHELTHWSGHKSRLDRDLKNRFGSRNYAAEELIAELGAAFLCAEFGFDGDVRNASYIANWIELLTSPILVGSCD